MQLAEETDIDCYISICVQQDVQSTCSHVSGRIIILRKRLKTSKERRLNSWVSVAEELMVFRVSLDTLIILGYCVYCSLSHVVFV